ncbi:MAG: M13 family metallopeptidase [Flavobacteriales bacterium]
MAMGCALMVACGQQEQTNEKVMKGVDVSTMDTSINACEDFYRYANAKWLDETEIPSTESRWGSFNELRDRNQELIKGILEEAAKDSAALPESERGKVGIFYRTAMDTARRNKLGLTPLNDELAKIESISSKGDLLDVIVRHHLMNVPVLFDIGVDQDMKNSTQYLFEFAQGGMGLPIPELYYDPAKAGPLKNLYQVHIKNMFVLAGMEPAEANQKAGVVLEIETELARHAMTAEQRRNLDAQYNKMDLAGLQAIAPAIEWDRFLDGLGIDVEEFNVAQPDFFRQVNTLFEKRGLDDWKAYLKWFLLSDLSDKLSEDFERENFNFYGTVMRGTKEMKPLWKRSLQSANGNMGQMLGKEFIKTAFSPESKDRLNKLIDNLLLAFRQRLENLEWMSDESKVVAFQKLDSLQRKIGYPDEWIDFSSLQLTEDSYVENCIRCQRFWVQYHLNKLGKPVDKSEWNIPPQIVNAFYNPTTNSICFPAGILQPPFMDPEADDAVLYGTIGAVIGHELTHGFDDMGKQFDASGNKRNWWTAEDSARFGERTQKLVEQFNNYEVLDSVFVNGKLTLGENIADLGGLITAYYAFRKSMEGKKDYFLDGFTCNQMFFIAYAQLWRAKATEAEARRLAMLDPHSPPAFRVSGTLSNVPEFYKAFGCSAGSAYFHDETDRVVIW